MRSCENDTRTTMKTSSVILLVVHAYSVTVALGLRLRLGLVLVLYGGCACAELNVYPFDIFSAAHCTHAFNFQRRRLVLPYL